MEHAKAVILNHTPEPERISAASARISTTPGSATEIYAGTSRENIGRLIRNVMGIGHHSITEHASFTIGFENVSVFFEQFLIEFRLAAYTVKSRRYVDYGGMGWLTPDFRFHTSLCAEEKDALASRYQSHMETLFAAYSRLVEMGIPKEDARFLLPYSFRSHIYCTMNARELMHFLYACLKGRGARYPEIVAVGGQLKKDLTALFPDAFEALETVLSGSEEKEMRLKDRIGAVDGEPVQETRLVGYTPDGERLVAMTALMAQGLDPETAARRLAEDATLEGDLLAMILADRRPRELEQVNYTFRIPGISLAGLTHLVRHRIQNIVVPDFARFGKSPRVILPQTVQENPAALALYESAVSENRKIYETFSAAGLVAEDSVYLLVAGNTVDVVTTMNARQLHHFLRLRTCYRAQWEIREIAIAMREQLVAVAPGLFRETGPGCFPKGKCPEGKMSCGRMAAVRRAFGGDTLS